MSSQAGEPALFNYTKAAHPGDFVGVYGGNLGPEIQVWLENHSNNRLTRMPIIHRIADRWISVRIPISATGAIILRVGKSKEQSAKIFLNRADPYHLDALEIVPGGAMRVFGINLRTFGYTPTVSVNGHSAEVDLSKSSENMLTMTAPKEIHEGDLAAISVDNGNGSGAALLTRKILVRSYDKNADVFHAGVGWAGIFGTFISNVIEAKTSPNLLQHVKCDGVTNDSRALAEAIHYANKSLFGAVVQLPSGTCLVQNSVELMSRVVLRGSPSGTTTILYDADRPIYASEVDGAGLTDLTMVNRAANEGLAIQNSRHIILRNVSFQLGKSRQLWMPTNENFAIVNCTFVQQSGTDEQGPMYLSNNGGLVLTASSVRFVDGAIQLPNIHDAFISSNRFVRDGSFQNNPGTVHTLALDFAHHLTISNNTLDVEGAVVTNKHRNDGEAILTEGGGAKRTESVGEVIAATPSKLVGSSPPRFYNPPNLGAVPENAGVAIVSGVGAGQSRRILKISVNDLGVDAPWVVTPIAGSHYATFIWGLEDALIIDNTLMGNPRGIWLYQTSVRNVYILRNSIIEGGGIYLRAAQKIPDNLFAVQLGVTIEDNVIRNGAANWGSNLAAAFIRMDPSHFGIGMFNLEVRRNRVEANRMNLKLAGEDHANREGIYGFEYYEGLQPQRRDQYLSLIGLIFQANVCSNCQKQVDLGPEVGGIVEPGRLN